MTDSQPWKILYKQFDGCKQNVFEFFFSHRSPYVLISLRSLCTHPTGIGAPLPSIPLYLPEDIRSSCMIGWARKLTGHQNVYDRDERLAGKI